MRKREQASEERKGNFGVGHFFLRTVRVGRVAGEERAQRGKRNAERRKGIERRRGGEKGKERACNPNRKRRAERKVDRGAEVRKTRFAERTETRGGAHGTAGSEEQRRRGPRVTEVVRRKALPAAREEQRRKSGTKEGRRKGEQRLRGGAPPGQAKQRARQGRQAQRGSEMEPRWGVTERPKQEKEESHHNRKRVHK